MEGEEEHIHDDAGVEESRMEEHKDENEDEGEQESMLPPLPPPPPPAIPDDAPPSAPTANGGGFDLGSNLKDFEEVYLTECAKERPAPEAKFNYAWALVRSQNRDRIRKGIAMLRGLSEDRYCEDDCLYYCAVGHYRLDNLLDSRRCLEALLKIRPNCRPAISLLDVVEDRIVQDGTAGIAITGAFLAAAVAFTTVLFRQKVA
eukprot:Plantae.Rhodophyta-Purpureofilum_apyrenoidigerum.ctg2768.p1 GENE.Plantae.Rhodophyta-Purpureofilum_apyrenoidigerum.ctg2768~~Plantae.Rhodophyta-Purpureofilum_apyrenoidigerum.ctg2768.p1  ORF type:complete len:216 (+),score=42.24 Plantae.Rhodophyta-Purpureofilum_apyrenoidigerum.ctg2768:40-648(+)